MRGGVLHPEMVYASSENTPSSRIACLWKLGGTCIEAIRAGDGRCLLFVSTCFPAARDGKIIPLAGMTAL